MVLEVKDLNYQDFKNISYTFNEKSFYTIIGCNKSGKTTLFRLLSGIIPNKCVICCNFSPSLSNRKDYIKNIGVAKCLDNKSFLYQNVCQEMSYPLKNLGYSSVEIKKRILEVLKYFHLESLFDKKIKELSVFEKQILLIMISLLHQPKVLLMDSCFDNLNYLVKHQIITVLKEIIQKENVTIINFTTSLEEGMDSDKIILLNNYKIVQEFNAHELTSNDKLFYDNNIEIPFIVDLNVKLRMYNLINHDYYNMKELVDSIWP